MPILSLAGKRPAHLGVCEARLAPCPSSPNCVSSDTERSSHRVEPFRLAANPTEAWRAMTDAVSQLPRTRTVTAGDDYLHAECESALLGFVDDLELHLRPEQGIVAVRSASRLGRSDFGVNRKRVEALRAALVDRGVVEA